MAVKPITELKAELPAGVRDRMSGQDITDIHAAIDDAAAVAVMSLFRHLMALKTPVAVGGGEYVLPFYRALATWAQTNGIDLSRGGEIHVVDFNEPST